MTEKYLDLRPFNVGLGDHQRDDTMRQGPDTEGHELGIAHMYGARVDAVLAPFDQTGEPGYPVGAELIELLGGEDRLAHKKDPVVLGLSEPERHVGAGCCSQNLDGIGKANCCVVDRCVQLKEAAGTDLEQQLVLVDEVEVDRGWCAADCFGDGSY